MNKQEHRICRVLPGSIAEALELKPGDVILTVNGHTVTDIFDYDYLCADEYLSVLVRTAEGEELILEIEKGEDEDLGILFENSLMDEYHSCRNKCVFCFIDQMPPGMRETLYFKDDDSRLSFLQGNYVTLTNMSEEDIRRIIRYHLAPINISIHTMNPDLRCRMLNNRFAGKVLRYLDLLYEAETEMNGQIVMCPGWNDGEELDRTIGQLGDYAPVMQSVSVVPVGMTKYRDHLTRLDPVTPEIAAATIDCIEKWQKIFLRKHGIHFVHASDEFYILAGRPVPEEERYDGYIQLENGVGFIRLLTSEFTEALSRVKGDERRRDITVATGRLIAPYLEELSGLFRQHFPNVRITIRAIRNDFFGEQITVAGLITGQDLIAQLKDSHLGDCLYLPLNMLRSGEEVFLDDLTVTDLERELQVPVHIVRSDGSDLLSAWMGEDDDVHSAPYAAYENEECKPI